APSISTRATHRATRAGSDSPDRVSSQCTANAYPAMPNPYSASSSPDAAAGSSPTPRAASHVTTAPTTTCAPVRQANISLSYNMSCPLGSAAAPERQQQRGERDQHRQRRQRPARPLQRPDPSLVVVDAFGLVGVLADEQRKLRFHLQHNLVDLSEPDRDAGSVVWPQRSLRHAPVVIVVYRPGDR